MELAAISHIIMVMKWRSVKFGVIGLALALLAPQIRDAAAFVLTQSVAVNSQLLVEGVALSVGCL